LHGDAEDTSNEIGNAIPVTSPRSQRDGGRALPVRHMARRAAAAPRGFNASSGAKDLFFCLISGRFFMQTKTTNQRDAMPMDDASLPTTFVCADESAQLTKMLELEFEQAQQVAGGLAKAVRCCACHCCSCHC
jgi:hypothetical protein